jgi:DMSO/TMAO reductase YedYZ molybdopterin-dependent catalytic subunit
MLVRYTNTVLLALLVALTLSGLWGLAFTLHGWLYDLHRAAAWALVALLPWKALIAWRSLRRGFDRRFNRSVMLGVSLLLATLFVVVLASGLAWTWRIGPRLYGVAGYVDTAISWHWMIALGLLAPLALHVWRRWPRPKRRELLTRRSAFKLAGLTLAGTAGWWAAERWAQARVLPSEPRAASGSVQAASYSGNNYPVTHSVGEGQITLDPATWFLAVHGAVERPFKISYADLLAQPAETREATLDCTTGWFSTQQWTGTALWPLLEHAGLKTGLGQPLVVRLRGVSGYFGDFTLDEARGLLLATHVGGEVLTHLHGHPVRAVAPTRRGWLWIKWLTEVEVLGVPAA